MEAASKAWVPSEILHTLDVLMSYIIISGDDY